MLDVCAMEEALEKHVENMRRRHFGTFNHVSAVSCCMQCCAVDIQGGVS